MLKVIQDNSPKEEPWYSDGLRFKCTECGKCCTGSPGYVWVTEEEIKLIADHLKISVKDFSRRYLRRVHGQFSLIEKSTTYDCIFLKDKKCQIYQVRPVQCRTFPWWPQNLNTKESWEETAKSCEGIQDQAPVVPLETIETQLSIYKKNSRF
jgi:Fe-S-cluster containining protein